MTSPVNNDRTLTVTPERELRTQRRQADAPVRAESADTPPANGSTPAAQVREADLGRASRLFRAETGVRSAVGDAVTDASQARSLLEQLKARMAADPDAALRAMGGGDARGLAALLEQAPA